MPRDMISSFYKMDVVINKTCKNHFYKGEKRSTISDTLCGHISKQTDKSAVNIIKIEMLLSQATVPTDAIKNEF